MSEKTLFEREGFRFLFLSGMTTPQVGVSRLGGYDFLYLFNLTPEVRLVNGELTPALHRVRKIIEGNREELIAAWEEWSGTKSVQQDPFKIDFAIFEATVADALKQDSHHALRAIFVVLQGWADVHKAELPASVHKDLILGLYQAVDTLATDKERCPRSFALSGTILVRCQRHHLHAEKEHAAKIDGATLTWED